MLPRWINAGIYLFEAAVTAMLPHKFAAHRQLARWAHKRDLSPHQRAKRTVLVRAVRTLEHNALADGCELRIPSEE